MKKIIVLLIAVSSVLVLKGMGSRVGAPGSDLPDPGVVGSDISGPADDSQVEHDFSLEELGGGATYSLSDFEGKPLFIDFWASWCPPCRASAPYVERLSEEFSGRANVVGINLDSSLSAALGFLGGKDSGVLHLAGHGTDISQKYGVRGIPTFVILDSSGNIVSSRSGFTPAHYDEWVRVLESLEK